MLFVPRSKAALELYETWIDDHMENSATVGIDQVLKGKPLVNTSTGCFCLQYCLRASWKFISRPDLLSLRTAHQGHKLCKEVGECWGIQRRCLKKIKTLSAVYPALMPLKPFECRREMHQEQSLQAV